MEGQGKFEDNLLIIVNYLQTAYDSTAMWVPFERRRPDLDTKREIEKMVLKILSK